MAYSPTPTEIQAIRYELNDNEAGLYILDDATISYYLTKHQGGIVQTSLDCAKAILFKLSMTASDETVDIFSIKGSKASAEYREALKLYIKDPSLNGLYSSVKPYISGSSIQDIQSNQSNLDNLYVAPPDFDRERNNNSTDDVFSY